jgi:outer membrane protein
MFIVNNFKFKQTLRMIILDTKYLIRLATMLLLLMGSLMINAQSVMTIDDAIGIALKNNFSILINKNNERTAKENNTLGNAGMLPTIGITSTDNAGVSDAYQKYSGNTDYRNPALTSTLATASVQLNWTLYDGGKMFVTRQKLKEIQTLGEIQFRDTVTQVLFNVIAAYYDVVRQKQQLTSINEALSYNKERVKIAQASFNAGMLLKGDLLQAQIDLNVTTENEINQEFIIKAGFKNLNVLLGRNADEPFAINDSIPLNYSPDREALIRQLNTSNTDILSAQKQIQIAELALKENRSLYLPNLTFKTGYFLSQTVNSGGSILYNGGIGPQVGGTLTVPIYSAGETKRKEKIAKIQAESAEYTYEATKLRVNTLLENTLDEFEIQQKLVKIESENNELAKEHIKISIERLRLGQTTSLEVHLAEEDYVRSCTSLINFRYNLKIAEAQLKQLVATL